MTHLWLTYAWADNDDGDVDHVIAELERCGVEVRYDRQQIRAGERLWSRIDQSISDATTAGWAIFVTKSSLQSEACQEELAYALDRALRARGDFPIIGIFSEPIDRMLIPSAIATRKYVNLRDPDWMNEIRRSLTGGPAHQRPEVTPFSARIYRNTRTIFELRPRSGRWYPFTAAVPTAEKDLLDAVYSGPSGAIPSACISHVTEVVLNDGAFSGIHLGSAIDPQMSAFIQLTGMPSQLVFGEMPDMFCVQAQNIPPSWYV